MGIFVIASFRPKPGKADELLRVVLEHVPLRRRLGMVTDFDSIVLQAAGGEVLELLEWKDQAAIDAAHKHPEILASWSKYEACSEFMHLKELKEASEFFPRFTRVPMH